MSSSPLRPLHEDDAENATGAPRLYEGAGMHRVRQNDNWTLELVDEGSTESDN
jgi:hypothetical protein